MENRKTRIFDDTGLIAEYDGDPAGHARERANAQDGNINDNPYEVGTPEYLFWRENFWDEVESLYFSSPDLYFNEEENIRSVEYYIERAKVFLGTDSNRKLSEALRLAPNAVSGWDTGKTFPSQETMVELATIAEMRPDIAICELNIWKADKAKTQETLKLYKSLMERLNGVATIAILAILTCISSPSRAANITGTYTTNFSGNIHYHTRLWRFFVDL